MMMFVFLSTLLVICVTQASSASTPDKVVDEDDWQNIYTPRPIYEPSPAVCNKIHICRQRVHGEFIKVMDVFNYKAVHSKLDTWCKPHEECWIEGCFDERLKKLLELEDEAKKWICEHKAGFEDTSCFQDPFQNRIQSCYYQSNLNVAETLTGFHSCVMKVLNELPGCKGDKKETVKAFFDFQVYDLKAIMSSLGDDGDDDDAGWEEEDVDIGLDGHEHFDFVDDEEDADGNGYHAE